MIPLSHTLHSALLATIFLVFVSGAAHSQGPSQTPAANSKPGSEAEIRIAAPPEELRKSLSLSDFYTKHASASGIPVLSSKNVSDEALREAVWIIEHMMGDRDDVRRAIIERKIRVAVMAPSEQTIDIPEHSDLTPADYWNKRARGLGATLARPATSCGEENLLNLPGDRYSRENILVHEFAHTIHELGLAAVDSEFDARLQAAFDDALKNGLWKNTYAATNPKEYWAEGVQSYFDTNDANNSQHNHVDTREELRDYDPELFALIDDAFRQSPWRYKRPKDRSAKPSATP